MSPNTHLPFKTERLSNQESQLLRRKMLGVWFFGAIIGIAAGYFIFRTLGKFSGMDVPLIIFLVFFYAIIAFIIFVHTRNAFQTQKRIYAGNITDKKAEASSQTRNSTAHEDYYIALDGSWFRVELNHFQQVHVGDKVEICTLGKSQVFKIDVVQKEVPHFEPVIQSQTNLDAVLSGLTEQLTYSEKSVLKSHLRKAIFYRLILGFFGAWLIYLILNTLAVVFSLERSEGLAYFVYVHYLIIVLLFGAYLFLNKRTWLLILDLRSGKKEIITETIIDLVQSDHIKPGPNSMITITNTSHYKYYYIQTENFWLQANEETFHAASAGKNLLIQRSINTHEVLSFGF